MQTTDTLGRATFHHIEKRRGIQPTPREIRWLKHIERHGPQSSVYLHELTKNTHRDPDTSRRQLLKLRAGGLLYCPGQQRATEHAEFNPYIYDLSTDGRAALFDHDLAEETVRPSGHWVHQYMTACVTSSIDIAAARAGVTYIPAHRILARTGATLGAKVRGRSLIPDQLFGLDYGGRYRFFCLEVDRGTEPKASTNKRKSYRSMLESYRAFIGDGIYQAHYRLTAPMVLLVVLSSRTNEARLLDIAGEVLGASRQLVMTQVLEGFHGSFRPPPVAGELIDGNWQRAGMDGFRICDA